MAPYAGRREFLRAIGQLGQLFHARPADLLGLEGELERLGCDLAVMQELASEQGTGGLG